MTQDFLPTAVTIVNATFTVLRVAANVPQFLAILRDPGGARAISVSSWSVFAMANGSNGMYALVMAADTLMFAINVVSCCSCSAIAALAWIRQRRARLSEEAGVQTRLKSPVFTNAIAATVSPMARP